MVVARGWFDSTNHHPSQIAAVSQSLLLASANIRI